MLICLVQAGSHSGREIFDGLSKGLSVNRPCADRTHWGREISDWTLF